MTIIRAGAVVTPGQVHRPGWVHIQDRRVHACGAGRPPGPPDVDMPDGVVTPGFIDMHVHGGGGASFTDGQVEQAAAFHRRHGTTTMLASLVTATPAELIAAVGILAEATRAGTIAGIHLEGPWLSPARCGAHDPTRMRSPEPDEIDAVLTAAHGSVRMVTVAPELPGASAAIRQLRAANVVVAIGHTDATYEQTKAAIDLGATVGTHLFNAMPPLHHRQPGPVLALLQDRRVTVELIADGVHVHPEAARAVIAAVDPDRVALVTDAIAAAGCGDGCYRLGAVPIEVESGVARVQGTTTIAGSTATMDGLFRFAAGSRTDAELLGAAQMTSTTPARALGLPRVGRLEAGFAANLVVLQHNLHLSAVMTNGAWSVAP
ncbi:N-acetylglucosamine-6-phosphate deacetylase [Mycobacterium kubicae]|uniref:N-acetylglucosamine-6-phosphate deacetylase n=1 Tax=Mycobacterium kubicae TaxID=120959 RepID=UPI0007FBC981|nr:N-acetylglucosamine-6-phosphate deacetylase [Mycobacterium kubicae]OBF15799.1 N-acetylglucosamine-6-phosphate deacetylase [Mycobacterium kubicae]